MEDAHNKEHPPSNQKLRIMHNIMPSQLKCEMHERAWQDKETIVEFDIHSRSYRNYISI
jgi:hypothetical protein